MNVVARQIASPASHVSAVLSGNAGIGDKLAAKIERVFMLEPGSLDEDPTKAAPIPEIEQIASAFADVCQQKNWPRGGGQHAATAAGQRETVTLQQHHLYQQGNHRLASSVKRLSVEWDQQQCVDEKDAPAENGPNNVSLSPQHPAHRAGSYGHRMIRDITVNFKSHSFSPL